MSHPPDAVLALAAVLVPGRASRLLSRHQAASGDTAPWQPGAPRGDRLAALAEALRDLPGPRSPVRDEDARWPEVREPASGSDHDPAGSPPSPPARCVLRESGMLPFDLPSVAPALLEVDRSLRELGARVAVMAATGLASVIGGEVAVRGRLLPTLPEPAGVALLPIELTALAGRATLAVECSLAARVAERVAGGTGRVAAAGTLGPAERAILELAVLGALDAIAADPAVEGALAPRLALRGGAPARSICVELVITAVGTQGRAYLALPESALRALPRTGDVPQALADVPVPGSLRGGHVSLAPGELDGLRSGDVLLLDEPPPGGAALLLAGGVTARGNLDGDSLEIEDVALPAGAGHDSPPIRIEVELATVDVPLRDVARIAPGAVIALRLDRRGEVTLRVGEMALARGELVDVDGTVGVRISSVERSR